MPWKCQMCGIENDAAAAACVGRCGYVRMPQTLTLTGAKKARSIRVGATFGPAVLRDLGGDDARFAADPQFELVKDAAAGVWRVRHLPGAANPTYYNGEPVGPDSPAVADGGVISIGPKVLKLVVTLSFDG